MEQLAKDLEVALESMEVGHCKPGQLQTTLRNAATHWAGWVLCHHKGAMVRYGLAISEAIVHYLNAVEDGGE